MTGRVNVPNPVTIRGVTYLTAAAAARALGVSSQAVHGARRRGQGALDAVGLRPKRRRGLMPVCVRGQQFASVAACAAHFGVSQAWVYTALHMGRIDAIGCGRWPRLEAAE